MNANHKPTPRPTIGSLLNEIMGLLKILITICLSYIEDFTREILNLAISHDTIQSEHEEGRERAVHFADGFHDGDWQRDMEQDYSNEPNVNWNGGDTNKVRSTTKLIYDGVYDDDKE